MRFSATIKPNRFSLPILDPKLGKRPCRFSAKVGGSYIDKWFGSIVKSEEFYETHAEFKPRRYFYNVDLQGRLFLEETLSKNIATSIKDERFLDFFFRNTRPVGPREEDLMEKLDIDKSTYPFVSPCGKELNFIRPADTCIVFHTFHSESATLVYAGTKSQDFKASHLAVSEKTCRLYHRCSPLERAAAKMNSTEDDNSQQFALIRSAVVVALSDRIGPDDAAVGEQESSGLAFFSEGQEGQPIPWLPQEAEPGAWAMPFSKEAPDG